MGDSTLTTLILYNGVGIGYSFWHSSVLAPSLVKSFHIFLVLELHDSFRNSCKMFYVMGFF